MSEFWQDALATLAALVAGAWLLRRWLLKRRAKAGCDRCAAAYLRTTKRPEKSPSEVSTR